jgi:NADH-quinone oxidoreductase subunit L
MTVPLVLLAICSIGVGWGWPILSREMTFPFVDPHSSLLEQEIHHAQHPSVYADFGVVRREVEVDPATGEERVIRENDPEWQGGAPLGTERFQAHKYAHFAGNLALGVVLLGIVFSSLLYYYRTLDPDDAKAQFPAVHRFLWHKWYFDEAYSALLVRPALVVARWCRLVDAKAIDGTVDATATATVKVAKWDGRFDLHVIDGIANLLARVTQGVGNWLRGLQTGYLRSYVLFLVLAAVGIFVILSYVLMAWATP